MSIVQRKEEVRVKLYLYLARRDKKGIKLLLKLWGPLIPPTQLTSVKMLRLPLDLERQVEKEIAENRMTYAPWIETAENFQALKLSLRNRGYIGLPARAEPLFRFFPKEPNEPIQTVDKNILAPNVTTSRLQTRQTMLGG